MHKVLLFLTLTTLIAPLLSINVGLSCLINPKTNQKVGAFYDIHDYLQFTDKKSHQVELTNFIEALSKRSAPCSWYIEFPHRAMSFKGVLDSTIHVSIKDALAHSMKHGSIHYQTFDERSDSYFWIRDLIINPQPMITAFQTNYPFPKSFYNVTIKAYIQELEELEKSSREIVQKLPDILQSEALEKISLYKKIQQKLQKLATLPEISLESHMIKLVNYLTPPLGPEITEAGSIYMDLYLLDAVLHDKQSLIIVHAGAYHANELVKALKKIGFIDALPDRNLLEGLSVDDIQKIVYPTNFCPSFIQPMYEFLSLCNTCGKETTIKCSACKKTHYCTRDCQAKDWQSHKLICKKP